MMIKNTIDWILIGGFSIFCVFNIQKANSFNIADVSFVPLKSQYQFGVASYYDYVLDSGWSSIGHRVCATRDYKRYSYIKVTNIVNDKSVICKVTDYGPDASIFPERIVDLSSTAFSDIANIKLGIINVKIETYNY